MMEIEEGIELIKEAVDEYDEAVGLLRVSRLHSNSAKDQENKLGMLSWRVNNIFKSCPALRNYVEFEEDFFSSSYFGDNLHQLLNKYEQSKKQL